MAGFFDQALTDLNNGIEEITNFFGYSYNTGNGVNPTLGKWIDEGWGEITGRNKARKDQMTAKDNALIEAENKRIEIKNNQEKTRVEDVQASNYAAGLRKTADAQANPQVLGGAATTDPSQDFLGLS